MASLTLAIAQRRTTADLPRMLGNSTWEVFNSSHLNDPPDPWSGGQVAPGVLLSGPVQLCSVLRLRDGFGPGQRTEQKLHPCLAILLGGSASWSMGPISVCSGEGGTCMKGSM